jgi:hypothetical protein
MKPISQTGKNVQRSRNVPSSHLCTADLIAEYLPNLAGSSELDDFLLIMTTQQ